jgi:FixJ family two-component response regulator
MDFTVRAATIFIVDDDPSVLKSLERLVKSTGFEVETFASPKEFLRRQDPTAPGCLVLDIAMPELNGLELQEALAEVGNSLPIVFITGHGDVPMSVRAMKAGAIDFLSKPFDDEELLAAIKQALEKDQLIRQQQVEAQKIQTRLAKLSPREHEVLTHVISGKLNKQIAADLGTVEKTIKVHRGREMKKMEVESVAELVRLAEYVGIRPVQNS